MTSTAILITGASSGIGKACALHLDRLGFQVFAGVRKQADAEALAELGSEKLTPVMVDVVDNSSITAAVTIEFHPLEEIRRVLEVNLLGQIAVTKACMPLLRKGQGRIVNMSSISGLIAAPFVGPYAISKFALEAFSDALRRELMPWDMHVAIIEPGRINTPIWEKSLVVVENILEQLPAKAHTLYGQAFDTSINATLKSKQPGTSPEAVAQAVTHALTARKPKLRYPVGLDAKVVKMITRFFPERWTDAILAKQRGFE